MKGKIVFYLKHQVQVTALSDDIEADKKYVDETIQLKYKTLRVTTHHPTILVVDCIQAVEFQTDEEEK